MPAVPIRLAWRAATGDREERRATAWGLVMGILADVGFPAAQLTNPCPRCGGPHGPVRVAGAPFRASVTYAAGFAIVAVMAFADADMFGIDAEPRDDARRDGLGFSGMLSDVMPGGDHADAAVWTRVEAALKADGHGLNIESVDVRVERSPDGWRAVVPGRSQPFEVRELAGPPGLVVSAAWLPAASREVAPNQSTT